MANTRRENRLEELGRVDAEKAFTSKGKRNLRDQKSQASLEKTKMVMVMLKLLKQLILPNHKQLL